MVSRTSQSLLLGCLFLCCCSAPHDEVVWEWVRASNRHDVARAAALFTEDGVLVLPDGTELQGRARILDHLKWRQAVRAQVRLWNVDTNGQTVSARLVDHSEWTWLLGDQRVHFPNASFALRGDRIARIDPRAQNEFHGGQHNRRLREFEAWAASNRPDGLARIRDGGTWRFEPDVAPTWLQLLESWRMAQVPELELVARTTEKTLPFGTFPLNEGTLRNRSTKTLVLVPESTPPKDSYLGAGIRITDGNGLEYGRGSGIAVEPGEVLHPGDGKVLSFPSANESERLRKFYRTQARAMPPGEYRYRFYVAWRGPPYRLVLSPEESFVVTDDGSPELDHLRNARNEVGVEDGLRLLVERNGENVSLFAVNVGAEDLAIGTSWYWQIDGPKGSFTQADGLGGDSIEVITPGDRRGLQGLHIESQGPGRYRVSAVYCGQAGNPLKMSNTVKVYVQPEE